MKRSLAMARIINDHNWRHDVATSERITLPRDTAKATGEQKKD